jgi:hypothetical protein
VYLLLLPTTSLYVLPYVRVSPRYIYDGIRYYSTEEMIGLKILYRLNEPLVCDNVYLKRYIYEKMDDESYSELTVNHDVERNEGSVVVRRRYAYTVMSV